MNKKKWVQKVTTSGLIVVMILASGAFPSLVSASENVDLNSRERLSTIERVNPELSMDDITSMIKEYAKAEGITESVSLELFYKEAQTQQLEQESNEYSLNSSSNPDQAPGSSLYKGDVMYSNAWTGINHGHSAIYYTKDIVVHAPGIGQVSKAESAHNKIGLKNGIQIQYVNTNQTSRDIAANYAYNSLRNKAYNTNFAVNKSIMAKLNCSSLVWYAYKSSLIDLDGNGGPGVYPSDIRDSPLTVTYAWK